MFFFNNQYFAEIDKGGVDEPTPINTSVFDNMENLYGISTNPELNAQTWRVVVPTTGRAPTNRVYRDLFLNLGQGEAEAVTISNDPTTVTSVTTNGQISCPAAKNLAYLAACPTQDNRQLTGDCFTIDSPQNGPISVNYNIATASVESNAQLVTITGSHSKFQSELKLCDKIMLNIGDQSNFFQVVEIESDTQLIALPVVANEENFANQAMPGEINLIDVPVEFASTVGNQVTRSLNLIAPNVNMGTWFAKVNARSLQISNDGTFVGDTTTWTPNLINRLDIKAKESLTWKVLNPDTAFSDPTDFGSYIASSSDLGVVYEATTLDGQGTMRAYMVENDPFFTVEFTGAITPALTSEFLNLGTLAPVGTSNQEFTLLPPLPADGSGFQILLFTNRPITFETITTQTRIDDYLVVDDGATPAPQTAFFQIATETDAKTKNLQLPPNVTDPVVGEYYQQDPSVDGSLGFKQIVSAQAGSNPLVFRFFRIPGQNQLPTTITPGQVQAMAEANKDIVALSGAVSWTATNYTYAYSGTSLSGWNPSSSNPVLPLMVVPQTDNLFFSTAPTQVQDYTFSMLGRDKLVKADSATTFQFSYTPMTDGIFPNVAIASANGVTDAQITDFGNQAIQDITDFNNNQGNFPPEDNYVGNKKISSLAYTVAFLQKVFTDSPNLVPGAQAAITAGITTLKTWMNQRLTTQYTYDSVTGAVLFKGGYFDVITNLNNVNLRRLTLGYGYLIITAVLLDFLDNTWKGTFVRGTSGATVGDLVTGIVKTCVNDDATLDPVFSRMRTFLFSRGYSNATGLNIISQEGVNLENTAEDALFFQATRLWGTAIGDTSMNTLGQMLVARQARAAQILYQVGSTNSMFKDPNFPAGGSTIATWSNVGILWTNQAQNLNSIVGTSPVNQIVQIGSDVDIYLPTAFPILFDKTWATRIRDSFYINSQTPDDLSSWALFTDAQASQFPEWITINLVLLAFIDPAKAQAAYIHYNEITVGTPTPVHLPFDSGNTPSMIIFLCILSQLQQSAQGAWTADSFNPGSKPGTTVPTIVTPVAIQGIGAYLADSWAYLKGLSSPTPDQQALLVLYNNYMAYLGSITPPNPSGTWSDIWNNNNAGVAALGGKFPAGQDYDALVQFSIATMTQTPLSQ